MMKFLLLAAFGVMALLFAQARGQTASIPMSSPSALSENQLQEMHQVGALEKTMNSQDILAALSDVSVEFNRCSQFYLLGWTLANNSRVSAPVRSKFHVAAKSALSLAIDYGKKSGMTAKTIQATSDMFAKELTGKIGSNGNNYIVLVKKYGNTCKEMLSDAAPTLLKYLQFEKIRGERARN